MATEPGVRSGGWFAARLFAAGALSCCGVGCRPPEADLVPAGGVVLIAGRPAAGVSVQFLPDPLDNAIRPTSLAVTDAEGRFRLKTVEGRDGAVVGGHTVILADTREERPAQGESPSTPPRIDSRYTTVAGAIRSEIPRGGGDVTLELP